VLALATVFTAAVMGFGIFGLVTSYRLHQHVQATYRETHRHARVDGDFSRGFGDVIRLHRYVWSNDEDDDVHVHRCRRRIRLAMLGVLGSGILAVALITRHLFQD
jgi:hypothetical protein